MDRRGTTGILPVFIITFYIFLMLRCIIAQTRIVLQAVILIKNGRLAIFYTYLSTNGV